LIGIPSGETLLTGKGTITGTIAGLWPEVQLFGRMNWPAFSMSQTTKGGYRGLKSSRSRGKALSKILNIFKTH